MSDPSYATNPSCPKCGSNRSSRVKREGFLQKHILTHFGLYPWECSGCRTVFTVKNRGKLKRKRRSTGEIHLPPIN